MLITHIDMPDSTNFEDGLGKISMSSLGRLVVLAGKNGSGKSRLLQRISRSALSSTPVSTANYIGGAEVKSSFGSAQIHYRQLDSIQSGKGIRKPKIVYFVPKQLALKDLTSKPKVKS